MAKGGRKIYRTSSSYRKKRTRKVLKFFLVILLVGALVFLGYSIAKPIHNYFINNPINSSDEEDKPWTPPVSEVTDVSDTESDSEETTSPVEEPAQPVYASFSAYKMPVTALTSSDVFMAELNTAKTEGYTAIAVTLKAEGGKLHYITGSDMAKKDENAIVGTMYAGQIVSMIKSAGFTPIAYVNLLEDNNRYGENRTGSYRTSSDNTWLDNAPAKGGKPWLSPFEADTQDYIRFISSEITNAGFEYVVFDGAVFPAFRNSDLEYIGDSVKSPERYKALVGTVNIAVSEVDTTKCQTALNVSASKIISGTEEVFKPSELDTKRFVVEYIPSEIPKTAMINGNEVALDTLPVNIKVQTIFSEIQRLAGDGAEIIPVFRRSDFSQEDFNEAVSAVISLDCDSYFIAD